MRSKDILGRKIIDAAGTELGEVEDFEFDWETKSIVAIVLRAKEQLRGRLIKKIGGAPTQDISIPVEDVAVLGGVIILSTKLS
jgi:sporulation protein YlmC with PRC-barrel domain